MRRLSGETILSNDRSFNLATKKTATGSATADRESRLRHAAGARVTRTSNQSLARHVDSAAYCEGATRRSIAAPGRVPFHPPSHHAPRVPWRNPKANGAPAVVLSRRPCLDSTSFPSPSCAEQHPRIETSLLIRRWTLGVRRWTFSDRKSVV